MALCRWLSKRYWKKKKSLNIDTILMPTRVVPHLCSIPFFHRRALATAEITGESGSMIYVSISCRSHYSKYFRRNERTIFSFCLVSTTFSLKTTTTTFPAPKFHAYKVLVCRLVRSHVNGVEGITLEAVLPF